MNICEAIEQLIADSNKTKSEIARESGMTAQSLGDRLHRSKSMNVANAAKILDALGYELLITPKGEAAPAGSIPVDAAARGGENE